MNIEKLKRERGTLMDKRDQVKEKRKQSAGKLRAMLEETRELSEAEQKELDKLGSEVDELIKEVDDLEKEVDILDDRIKKLEKLAEIEAEEIEKEEEKNKGKKPGRSSDGGASEFRSFGEFISEVISNPGSPRLDKRTTTMGNPNAAGALVPPEFDTTLRSVAPEQTIVRPRATVIPGGSSPDAAFNLIAFDQTGDKGVYGGVTVNWTGEVAERQNAGDVNVRKVTLTPHIITGYMDLSNQLLGNYAAIGSFVQQQMSLAIAAAEERAFLRGTGQSQPAGFIGHTCNATVERKTVGAISYEDIINMMSVSLSSGNNIFIASRSVMPQLMQMKDTAGNLIWQPNARDGSPGTLMGLPVMFSERTPVLGAQGDITLADLSQYVIIIFCFNMYHIF